MDEYGYERVRSIEMNTMTKWNVRFFSERIDYDNSTQLTIQISGNGIDWRSCVEFKDGNDLALYADTLIVLAETVRKRGEKIVK